MEETLQNASTIPFMLNVRVIGIIAMTIIMTLTAVKFVSVIEVVIIIVRELIRICVASIIGPIVIISTCLWIVLLTDSRVDIIAVSEQVVIIIIAPWIPIFIRVWIAVIWFRLKVVLKILIFIVVFDVVLRLRDFLHTFPHNWKKRTEEL